jgi:monomeric sarcosine oxidase
MSYDAIVIGAGGVGSAALFHLARRGLRVIGLDRFPPGHDRGSSHGQTRIIRQAYYEHPNYVPLLFRAYELWHELEVISNEKLFHQVGLMSGGPPAGEIIAGVELAADTHNLPIERLTAREAAERWPGFRVPESFGIVFESRAGYLMVEDCVRAHIAAAKQAGAQLRHGLTVLGWKPNGRGITVDTDEGALTADRLVITAGAWASDLLASLNVPFQVLRKPLFWYKTSDSGYNVDAGCPCFFFDTLNGQFYGFPQSGSSGVKIAEHTGGDPVADPLNVDRTLHTEDRKRVEACITEHLPGVSHECMADAVCMYTMSPDQHFVVGRHADHPQVVFTAGLSGHGFKFTSVLGEIMAELATQEKSRLPIEFLSPVRFEMKPMR